MKKPYFPEVEKIGNEYYTFIRLFHKGKYYLQKVNYITTDNDNLQNYKEVISRAYDALTLSIVDIEVVDTESNKLFIEDENQISEVVRVANRITCDLLKYKIGEKIGWETRDSYGKSIVLDIYRKDSRLIVKTKDYSYRNAYSEGEKLYKNPEIEEFDYITGEPLSGLYKKYYKIKK